MNFIFLYRVCNNVLEDCDTNYNNRDNVVKVGFVFDANLHESSQIQFVQICEISV